jgi:hypothetical protein
LSCKENNLETLKHVTQLPDVLKESSGIEYLNSSPNFWMINDSGNSNELFQVSETGEIEASITITNARNKDWEDLASNGVDELYIGDFGNNNNKRKNLVIYTVNINAINDTKVEALKTSFYFEDQKKFPPKKKDRNFDVEAFVYKEGYFYLFTKNRSSHFNGVTKLYKVLAKQGHQKAILMDSFVICTNKSDCLITSADLSKDKNELVLLTHNKLYVFTGFKEDYFFTGNLKEINLNHNSQKEAICYKNGNFYITDEALKNQKANLYLVK